MSAGLNPSEVQVGAHRVFWGPSGSETELGHTADGSVLRITQEQVTITTEEHGPLTPVTKIMAGEKVVAELILVQFAVAQLLVAIPGSSQGTGTDTASVYIGKTAGANMSSSTYAKRLRLHPITQTNTATETADKYINLAIPQPAPIEAAFNNRAPTAIGVIFDGIVDTTQSDGKWLARIRTAA